MLLCEVFKIKIMLKYFFKNKVVFTLEGGSKFELKCDSFDMTKLSGTIGKRELTIKGADRVWSVDLDKVIAVSAKRVFCLNLT